jgi:hypothetical protein
MLPLPLPLVLVSTAPAPGAGAPAGGMAPMLESAKLLPWLPLDRGRPKADSCAAPVPWMKALLSLLASRPSQEAGGGVPMW